MKIQHAAILLAVSCASPALAAVSEDDAKNGVVECTTALLADHNPGLAENPDSIFCFQAYISNFNTQPRKFGSKKKFLGTPHWIAHHVKRADDSPESKDRPDTWFTIPELAKQRIAPTDDSYAFSKKFRASHSNWYERGHLAQKYLAERLGGKSGWFTHNVINAVPQRSQFNKGAWLTLECFTGAWANKFGEVWVIAGPVYKKTGSQSWLRSDANKDALPVAIPPRMFKIVVRKLPSGDWDALGFVYPQTHKTYAKAPFDPEIWLKSVDDIEQLTGEKFLTSLPNAAQIKAKTATKIWPLSKTDFDTGCKNQKADVL